ncbi:NF038132 family protein [Sphingomonas sp. RS6]
MNRLSKSLIVSTIMAGAASLATPAAAQTCTGVCGTLGADGDVSASPLGGTYQYITTEGGVEGAGQIDGVGGTNGSEYRTQIFAAGSGDVLNFYFQYVTSDGAGYSDYGFAELLDGMGGHVAYLFTARTTTSGDTSPGFDLPPNDSTLNPGSTPIIANETNWSPLGETSGACFELGCGRTGWIQSSYEITMAGNYQLRFGVTNWDDTAWSSGLAFNGVTIGGNPIGVPEPAAWAMLIGGLGLAGGAMRTRRTRIAYA